MESDAKFHLAWLFLKRGDVNEATRLGRELVQIAETHGLDAAGRCAVLVASAMTIGAHDTSDVAARWLRILLGDSDLDFELRLYAEELLTSLGEPTTPFVEQAPRDLLSEVSSYLREQSWIESGAPKG